MKRFFLLATFLTILVSVAQTKNNYKISYSKTYNGNAIDTENPILAFLSADQCLVTSQTIWSQKADFPF